MRPDFARHIETRHTGDLVAVETFFDGHLEGVGKVYLQSTVDCHSRYAWGRLYPNKMPVTAVHLMNNNVLPTFEAQGARIATVLSDNGREFCGRPDRHPYELILQLEETEHRTTKVRRPQSNGFVERLHRTIARRALPHHGAKEILRAPSRPCRRTSTPTLVCYITERPHQGRGMKGKTPAEVFVRCLPKPKTPREDKMKQAA